MSIKSGKAMAKALKKMGKLTLPREKKKDKKAPTIEGDDYWDEKPKWNHVFDEDPNDTSQSDFICTESDPMEKVHQRPVAQSARTVAQSARKRPQGADAAQSNHGMTSTNRLTLPRGSSPHASPESKAEVARLEAEVSRLKLLLRDKSSGAKALSVDATARAFMLEDSSSYPTLEPFTSRKEKFALLDKAIENYDGAAMTRIVIWIKHSLGRDESYLNELRARPDAMNHYISYLREMKEFDELSDLLGILNRPEEEAFLDYQRKLEQSRPGKMRAEKLKDTLKFQFQSQRELQVESELIDEQIRLIEKQLVIAEKDKSNKMIPAEAQLKVDDTLCSTLWYANMYSAGDKNTLSSPDTLAADFNVRDAEKDWIALTALAKQQNWDQIELLVRKSGGLLGSFSTGPKYQTSIKLPNLVNLCGQNEMPIDRLRKFIVAIEDIDDRKQAAKKWNDHTTALEVRDAKNEQVVFEKNRMTFRSVAEEENKEKHYCNEIELFGAIDPDQSRYVNTGRVVRCVMTRAEEGEYWPRLTKEKIRIHWLKVDFGRWKDEDDSDDEDKAGADFELNDMLSGLRVDKDGNKQSMTDFDDLDDDSDDGEIDGIEDY
ncbi:Oidioi.mRNA.OKI2018_I69.XSR.g14810.t1.cds [Oikopleura dioica]|uniref:Spermatogenesis-defective protein 39 homolog n=1 Tax=Oikopleura dioica TaxID=34765 RepID=A0ABN7SJW8_OIKDI|nr:Oidioi.mRNA.OKI2018_I69.XSR.g14810.t1.cds [Oikopleura dioica]